MTRNPSWPRFLSSPDPDGLNAIEREALKPLRERFGVLTPEDAWWGTLSRDLPDGRRVVVPLYLSGIDRLCSDLERGIRHPSWSVSPESPY